MAGLFRHGGQFPRQKHGSAGSPLRAFRPVLLTAVVLVVCWAFWNNSQNRIVALATQNLFSDETSSLSKPEQEMVLNHIKAVKKESGLTLEVHILRQPPPLSQHEPQRIYLDILPRQRRAALTLPPLVRRAVGDTFVSDMERALEQDFASGRWQNGLDPALAAIRRKLVEVTQ